MFRSSNNRSNGNGANGNGANGNGSYQNGAEYQAVPTNGNGDHSVNQPSSWKKYKGCFLIAAAVIVVAFVGHGLLSPSSDSTAAAIASGDVAVDKTGKLKLFDANGRYVMEDYDAKPAFSNFLPGVAGYFGKPVWSFTVNRGQALASFGTLSKEYPILEFNAANKAYQLTPYIGFRSFIRGKRDMSSFEFEPFNTETTRNNDSGKAGLSSDLPKRIMYVGSNELEISEFNDANKIQTNVKYFVLPEEDFSSLVRRTTYSNTGSSAVTLDILDGLAKMEPSGGMLDWSLKNMGRTLEGWMGVYHYEDNPAMPFYKMSTEPSDSASVKIEEAGHYCLAFIESDEATPELLPIIFDTDKVFGRETSLEHPAGLMASSVQTILDNPQFGDAKTSSAFAALSGYTIPAGESITIASFYGKAEHIEELPKIVEIITEPGYVETKFERARSLIDELTAGVATQTANPLYNGAVKQMFLDNSLRGGMPTILGNIESDTNYDEDSTVKVFHAFSRIHGDLERDYNAFSIEPAYFSQGPGNYRDIAQNRRDDVTFLPKLGSYDVQMFIGYIQADGYEPLTVEAIAYMFPDVDVAKELSDKLTSDSKSAEILTNVLTGGAFRPGQLFELVDQLGINVSATNEDFLNEIVAKSEDRAMAVYGSGYWADHWDYYIDLVEAYEAIYPDNMESLMYDKQLRYFFSTATVKPRSEKYIVTMTFDGTSKHILQLDATFFDQDKVAEQKAFVDASTGLMGIDANWQRTGEEGKAFTSSPIAKLFLLGAIKYAMRDAYGMGVEYEGGRPGWNDAMNGLPGMVGSGMPETYEMYLLLKFVRRIVATYERGVIIPVELGDMITTVNGALNTLEASGFEDEEELPFDVPAVLFTYWDTVATAREEYRAKVEYYFSGETVELPADEIVSMLDRWMAQVELGMNRAMKIASFGDQDDGNTGIPPCYFSFEITDWKLNGGSNDVGLPTADALAMRVGRFPLFLEGPVRYMKTIQDDPEAMKDMYERVLTSGLRDNELNMYFLSASLKGQSYDMGRMMAFTPGWLENQSIWTHMSFKYYLQLLRGKLYEQFFDEMTGGGMMPFMDPDVYGRSLMECSSFMASSAFPDPDQHGRGFLARLSGSTAEFMSMYKLMFMGPELFYLNDDKELEMKVVAALPSWLFEDEQNEGTRDEDGALTVTYMLFGKIPVTYHNTHGSNLFGVSPEKYVVQMKSGESHEFDAVVSSEIADAVRRVVSVESIDAYFH